MFSYTGHMQVCAIMSIHINITSSFKVSLMFYC